MRIYVAGPIGTDPALRGLNVQRAEIVAMALIRAGHSVYCPHLWHHVTGAYDVDYEKWMTQDFDWISVSEVVVRIPGSSPGSDREVAFAKERGIWVVSDYGSLDDLIGTLALLARGPKPVMLRWVP